MMTFDLTLDFNRRALCMVELIASNAVSFTDPFSGPLIGEGIDSFQNLVAKHLEAPSLFNDQNAEHFGVRRCFWRFYCD